jgi:hypothetical protein
MNPIRRYLLDSLSFIIQDSRNQLLLILLLILVIILTIILKKKTSSSIKIKNNESFEFVGPPRHTFLVTVIAMIFGYEKKK